MKIGRFAFLGPLSGT